MTSEDRIQIRISLEAARVNAELLQKDAAKLIDWYFIKNIAKL